MLGLLRPYRKALLGLLACGALSNLAGLALPYLIGLGIDSYRPEAPLAPGLLPAFATVVVLVAFGALAQGYLEISTSERVALDLRLRLARRVASLDYLRLQQRDPARILTHLTSDVDAIKLFVSQAAAGVINSLLVLVGAAALLLYTEWRLGLTVLVLLPLIGLIFGAVLARVRTLFKQGREMVDRLNTRVAESVEAASLIRILHFEERQGEAFHDVNERAKRIGLQILKNFAYMIPSITFLSNLGTIAILLLGGRFVIDGSMPIGTLAAFNSYLVLLIFPVIVLGFLGNVIASAQASFGRLQDLLEESDLPLAPSQPPERRSAQRPDEVSFEGGLTVRGLVFHRGDRPVLKGLDLELSPGCYGAVVGPTTAGKSTLVELLCGLLPPDGGEVLYDGRYSPQQVQRQLGPVFQESVLFSGTLRENICLQPWVSADSYRKAIRTAELQALMEDLPQGEATPVAERGASLSGGQKQRVMLARALALDPKVLILDDTTARLDPSTEAKVLANLREEYPDLTVLHLSQRTAPIEKAERIYFLMEGEILGWGTHNQLLEECLEYRQFALGQQSLEVAP